jgi:hypothetical protein
MLNPWWVTGIALIVAAVLSPLWLWMVVPSIQLHRSLWLPGGVWLVGYIVLLTLSVTLLLPVTRYSESLLHGYRVVMILIFVAVVVAEMLRRF